MPSEMLVRGTSQGYNGVNGKQRVNIATQVAKAATEGEKFRRCRVKMSAAQCDVADGATISHTILSEVENGIMLSDHHHPRIRVALTRVAIQRMKLTIEALEELWG